MVLKVSGGKKNDKKRERERERKKLWKFAKAMRWAVKERGEMRGSEAAGK